MTFGFGNQHSIQLSYGRTQPDSTRSATERPSRTRVWRTIAGGFSRSVDARYNARLVLRQCARTKISMLLREALTIQPPCREFHDAR